jgi:hypothetical protein
MIVDIYIYIDRYIVGFINMSERRSSQTGQEIVDDDIMPAYAQFLAEDWSELLARTEGMNGQRNTEFLIKEVVPILVQALAELTKAIEKEEKLIEENIKLRKKNPSIKPRAPFNPLHWLASYLMRHNPKHNKAISKETIAYSSLLHQLLPK